MFRILVTLVLVDLSLALTCLDRKGQSVDWYIVYKLPANHSSRNTQVRQGVAFYYMDSEGPIFRLSDVSINSTAGHPLYTTLQQVYAHKTGQEQYAMYNDQPPEKEGSMKWGKYGHTKGMYAFDDKEGFWLISSVPEFPAPKSRGYFYKQKQTVLGQALLCVSLNKKYQTVIENIFNMTKPKIYDSSRGRARTFIKNNNKTIDVFTMTSLKGQTFKYFARSSDFPEDLYSGLVAPGLRESIYVHTWYSNLNSTCAKYKVMNIEGIEFTTELQFKSNKDHSKWAVSERGKWACVGDLNRAAKQLKRGGGTMCMSHPSVWKGFNDVIKSVDKC